MTDETADSNTSDVGETDNGSADNQNDIDSDYTELSLDDLLNADFSDDEILGREHKGLPDYKEILKHLPENGRKLVANLRGMTTRKTQELAEARASLETERAAIMREKEMLYSGEFARSVAAKASESYDELDMYDEKGLEKRIEIETAKRMQSMLAPLQEQMETQKRHTQLESFKRENPDLMSPEIKGPVAKLLVEREGLSLEDAYAIVKGKLLQEQAKAGTLANKASKDTQRDNLKKISSGKNVGAVKAPPGMTAWEAYSWAKNNIEPKRK